MFLRSYSKFIIQNAKANISLYEKNLYCFGSIKKFVLPDLGEKIKEATIKKWHVKEGDIVEEYQTLADVATDKLFTQIPSSEKGRIHKRYFGEDDSCEVGQVLLEIEVDEEAGATTTTSAPSHQTITPETKAGSAHQTSAETPQPIPATGSHHTFATPAVRALAKQHRLNISEIRGSGKNGRVTKEDILNFINKPSSASTSTSTPEANKLRDPETKTTSASTPASTPAASSLKSRSIVAALSKNTIKMSDFQKGMQKSMTEAASIPHFYFKDDYDVTKLNDFREKIKKNMGIKITFMPFIIKAASLALNEYPVVNSWYDKERPFEYTQVENHNISFAIDSPRGLVVPNIKNVQNLSILDIHDEFTRIIKSAQSGTLGIKDLTEGTFSISNIGNIGGTYLGPVLLVPQTCIVAIGKTQILPRYIPNEKGDLNLEPRRIMNVSFGADHRVLDGATVARFSSKWKDYMEHPENMILTLR